MKWKRQHHWNLTNILTPYLWGELEKFSELSTDGSIVFKSISSIETIVQYYLDKWSTVKVVAYCCNEGRCMLGKIKKNGRNHTVQ